jgi:hypothetical protein
MQILTIDATVANKQLADYVNVSVRCPAICASVSMNNKFKHFSPSIVLEECRLLVCYAVWLL